MKKTGWILLIVAVVAICGGVFLFTGKNVPGQSSSSSSSSEPVASSEISSVEPSSQELSSSKESEGVSSLTDGQITKKIQSEVPLNWKKYKLKEETGKSVKVGGVTYRTYSAWDEDYVEGPLLLYSPKDGKVYTYTAQDTAPILARDDPAFGKTEHTVTGVVKDSAMMSVEIHTTDGHDLTVRRLGVKLINLDNGFKAGQNVKVTYTGVYKGNNSQRMFVSKIEGIE